MSGLLRLVPAYLFYNRLLIEFHFNIGAPHLQDTISLSNCSIVFLLHTLPTQDHMD